MITQQLIIKNIRNIIELSIEPASRFNIIYGSNGAGKTSFLEAIYFLSMGRSFRTHVAQKIISKQASALNVFAKCIFDNKTTSIGIERTADGKRRVSINGNYSGSFADLARHLPLQLITTTSYRFFHDGPKNRRQFIDWGLFYTEPAFMGCWKSYQKALRQRNAAIKSQLSHKEIISWDGCLVEQGESIDRYRKEYIHKFTPLFHRLFTALTLNDFTVQLSYERGWDEGCSLADALQESLYRDTRYGYTQVGPQRADFQLMVNGTPAQDFLSQGEQKMAIYALSLAQGQLLESVTSRQPIYLIDDLPSELDEDRQQAVLTILNSLNAQAFVTAINKESIMPLLPRQNTKLFHMKLGSLV